MNKISDSRRAKFAFAFLAVFPCMFLGELIDNIGYQIAGRVASALLIAYLTLIFFNWEKRHIKNFQITMLIILVANIYLVWFSTRYHGTIDGRTVIPLATIYFLIVASFVQLILKSEEK